MGTEMIPANGSKPAAGAITRQDFGGQSLEQRAETSAHAIAAQARASVEARYIIAARKPRDWDDVRIRILGDMRRPGFAAAARYSKPVGDRAITGWSVRFAETLMRHMGNLLPEMTVIYDSATQRIMRVALTDLESNLSYIRDIVISKTVERKKPRGGAIVISERVNSYGERVCLVEATDDELANKEGALISKALRNHALRMCPGDILDECLEVGAATLEQQDTTDPSAARKKLADGFAALGVMPSAIKEYIGCDLGATSPAQLAELRAIYQAIRDGETSWSEISEARPEQPATPAPTAAAAPAAQAAPAAPKSIADLKSREKARTDNTPAKAISITVEGDNGERHAVSCPARIGAACECKAAPIK